MSWLFPVWFLFVGGEGNSVGVSNINFTEVQTEIASTVCGADDRTTKMRDASHGRPIELHDSVFLEQSIVSVLDTKDFPTVLLG